MAVPGKRILNLAGVAATAGMMGYALYAEHKLLLDPCPLCVFQRMFVIGLGIVFLVAAIHNSAAWGRYVYAGLLGVVSAGGTAVAAWHVYIQNLPADEVPACGPGFDYLIGNFPMSDALSMIFTGSGQCAEISWRFLGLSMPTWVAILVAALGVFGVWNSLRSVTQSR